MSVLQLVVRRLLLEILLSDVSQFFLELFSFLLLLVTLNLLFLESVFSLLCLEAGLLTILVVLHEVLQSISLQLLELFLVLLEVSVFHIDRVEDALILLNIIVPRRINCFEQSLVLIFDFRLFVLLGFDLLVDSADLVLEFFELLLVALLELGHLEVGVLLDELGGLE